MKRIISVIFRLVAALIPSAEASLLVSACGCDRSPPVARSPATTSVVGPEQEVRAAIDEGTKRPWGIIGTQYDVSAKARATVILNQRSAIEMLKTELDSSDRVRRANAYDYISRIFAERDPDDTYIGLLLGKHRANEIDPWVKKLADQVIEDQSLRRKRNER
jgi:hypothetical protein